MVKLFIKECKGYELEKALPNTSEDFFNRSEVTFVEDGNEKTLSVLYVRYFDKLMNEFTPFDGDPVFQLGSVSVSFKDIVAIVCLIKNPSFKERKRVYLHSQAEFASYFKDVDYDKLKVIFQSLVEQKGYELQFSIEQPQ